MIKDPALIEHLENIPVESVLSVHGKVNMRAPGSENPNMRTGDIEVHVRSVELLNEADALPFYATQCRDDALPKESLRARYRYLDLRRRALGDNIRRRSRVAHAARCYLHDQDFAEVETPVLLRSTPEGAREFLVPTRTPGAPSFYALQQSPQQPKQLLVASGVTDRYFQFAKCFRDEDGRKDRQPEFTQLDIEMGFVRGDGDGTWRIGGAEVRDTTEGVVRAMWEAAGQPPLPSPFPVLKYEHVMARYGSDKPDLRFGLTIHDVAPSVFPDASAALDLLVLPHYKGLKLSGRQIQALLVAKDGSRTDIEYFKAQVDAPGALAALLANKSRAVRSLNETTDVAALAAALQPCLAHANIYAGDAPLPRENRCDVFIVRRTLPASGGSTVLGDLRLRLVDALESQQAVRDQTPRIAWVTEFPLFTRDDEDKAELAGGRWSSSHHPFTAPAAADVPKLQAALQAPPAERDVLLGSIHGQHYDLVLNGAEIGGGSVRIHDPFMQEDVLRGVLEVCHNTRCTYIAHAR